MSYEEKKDLIKFMIKEQLDERLERCEGEECTRIQRELDKWHRDYADQHQEDEVDFCGFCSYNAPGVGRVIRGTRGCTH